MEFALPLVEERARISTEVRGSCLFIEAFFVLK